MCFSLCIFDILSSIYKSYTNMLHGLNANSVFAVLIF
jgi:hypothetical protein